MLKNNPKADETDSRTYGKTKRIKLYGRTVRKEVENPIRSDAKSPSDKPADNQEDSALYWFVGFILFIAFLHAL